MIVIDASILANALTDDGPLGVTSRSELARDPHWAAPEHLIIETFAALRGIHLGGKISDRRAQDALEVLAGSTIDLVSTIPLLSRMWELRDNVTGYDAAYVAVAEIYGCPLLTADARLARASGIRCEVRLAVPAGLSTAEVRTALPGTGRTSWPHEQARPAIASLTPLASFTFLDSPRALPGIA